MPMTAATAATAALYFTLCPPVRAMAAGVRVRGAEPRMTAQQQPAAAEPE